MFFFYVPTCPTISPVVGHSNVLGPLLSTWGNCRKLFCGFPGYKPVPPGWFKVCVGFIMGTPKGSPKVAFMEKPGIEPATPGLQGIALIHYTMAASNCRKQIPAILYDIKLFKALNI